MNKKQRIELRNNVIIYTLSNPITKEIRYVGKTSNSLKERLRSHLTDSVRKKDYKSCWVKSLLKMKLQPLIEELDVCNESNWEECEKYWISQMKSWGFNLTNSTEGGQAPPKITKNNKTGSPEKHIVYKLDRNGKVLKAYKNAVEAARIENISLNVVKDGIKNRNRFKKTEFIWCRKYQYKDLKIKKDRPQNKKGDENCRTIKTVYEFYKPNDYFKGTIFQFSNYINKRQQTVYCFVKKEKAIMCGWVLEKNKQQYDEIAKLYTLINDEGIVYKMTTEDFYKQFGITRGVPKTLKDGKMKQYKNWKYYYE